MKRKAVDHRDRAQQARI